MKSFNQVNFKWPLLIDPLEEESPKVEWVVNGFAARKYITVLGGPAGSGKSLFTQYLLQKRSNELFNVNRDGVCIYITGADTTSQEVVRRSHGIHNRSSVLIQEIPKEAVPYIADNKFYFSLVDHLSGVEVDTIVFDTIADFHFGNLYDPVEMNETMMAFRNLAERLNCAVILITHVTKGSNERIKYHIENISDSRIIGTKSDMVFAIKSEYRNDKTNLIELQNLKFRIDEIQPSVRMKIQKNENDKISILRTDDLFGHEEAQEFKTTKREKLIEEAKRLDEEGLSSREIGKKLNVSHTTANNYVKEN
ncbi:hypothetical protein A8B79_04860 [Balneola sp. EhC07]|uniref:AAA family ATPase n=1 Tax=Balneola sp. EhC07 TaxID=1849360 RepID=UPI0007F3AA03|nr:AAA family ATPase [Balneola sp. EhC07]OAN61759.1 hypothetical protein A8B79_04860 [Balneola sp. EhC07]